MLTNSDPSCSNKINHSNSAYLRAFYELAERRDKGKLLPTTNTDPNGYFQKRKYSVCDDQWKFFFLKGPYSLLISVKGLHSTFSLSHILIDESWSLESCRLLLGCSQIKQSSSDVRPAARRSWLVLTITLTSDRSTPQRACTGRRSHLFVRAGACEQTYCSHKSNGLCSCRKHTASSNINTSVCEYPGSVLLHYVCLPVYLNWTCICSQMGRFIGVLVLFLFFF